VFGLTSHARAKDRKYYNLYLQVAMLNKPLRRVKYFPICARGIHVTTEGSVYRAM
jgi:hypothetical protein